MRDLVLAKKKGLTKLREGENNYKKNMPKKLRMTEKIKLFKKMDKYPKPNKLKNRKERPL